MGWVIDLEFFKATWEGVLVLVFMTCGFIYTFKKLRESFKEILND